MKETLSTLAIIILLVTSGVIIASCRIDSDKIDIASWVESQDEVVKDIEIRTFSTGPYWPKKDYRFYRVETDKSTYWFQYGWSRSIEEEKEPGKYTPLDD